MKTLPRGHPNGTVFHYVSPAGPGSRGVLARPTFALLARTFQWADAKAAFPVVPCPSAVWLLSWVLDYSFLPTYFLSSLSLSGPLPNFKVLLDLASLLPIQSAEAFSGFSSAPQNLCYIYVLSLSVDSASFLGFCCCFKL